MIFDLRFLPAASATGSNHKSYIINHTCLQAYCSSRAGIHADSAVHARVRIHFRLAFVHADRTARALLHTGLATGAFAFIHFCWHSTTLSKNDSNHLGEHSTIASHPAITTQIYANSPTHGIGGQGFRWNRGVHFFRSVRTRGGEVLGEGFTGRKRRGYCSGPAGAAAGGWPERNAAAMPRTYSLGSFSANQSMTF